MEGTPHALVNEGDTSFFDASRAVRDLEAIVGAHRRFWGAFPYDRYLFLNLITEAGGGLEHARSSVLMTNRWTTRTRKAYLSWLELASHKLFHAWNVKCLRPVELGPFDYEQGVRTAVQAASADGRPSKGMDRGNHAKRVRSTLDLAGEAQHARV